MCIGKSPSIPAPPAPTPPPQSTQLAAPVRRKDSGAGATGGMSGGTLLTGAGGVAAADLNLGGKTLLGQ